VVRRSRQDGAALSLTSAINRAPLAILPAALLALACTRLNPDYCDEQTVCSDGRVCDLPFMTCRVPDAAPDAPVEPPRDAGAEAGDAKNSCASDDDCRTSAQGPTCVRGSCKRCQGANECKNNLFCAVDAGRCVECTDTEGCLDTPGSPICVQNRCALCTQRPGACVDRYPATPVCAGDGTCVECVVDMDCKSDGKPFCDSQTRKCVPCTTDAQCAGKFGQDPGVCLAHLDGHCATANEAVFVQQVASCTSTIGAGGTASNPYCVAQDGITAAVAGGKPLVVLRGPSDRWSFSSPAKPLLVVGQAGAKVVGAGVGIRASGGELYLRNLIVSVSGAIGTGVVADNGAILHMSRCSVLDNGAGGISVNNAGFDIVNTIVAGNAAGDSVPGTTFGGVYLSAAPGKPQRFLNNTIVGNKATGLYCAGAYPVKGILANGNSVREVFTCAPEASSLEPPQFDPARPYHLTPSSPCVNKGDPTEFPPDDIDGEPRPQMGLSDCGADELKAQP
jgi:hypothetical protein